MHGMALSLAEWWVWFRAHGNYFTLSMAV
jgi:hypothetical protein